jgi:hypothetical protein
LIFLFLGIGFAIAAFQYLMILLIVSTYLLAMILFIKDIKLNVFNDRFEIDHISIVKYFNVKESFVYSEIKQLKFDKGFTNIIGAILDLNSYISNSTNSKPDTIEVTLKDGNWRVLNRIGSRKEFHKACEIIIAELNQMNKIGT